MTKILVIGSMNMDVVNIVEKHPKPGETIHSLNLSYHPGGKGANQAVAAARAGCKVQMLAAVGRDENSSRLMADLKADQIDISAIKIVDGPCGLAFITVSRDGENTIISAPGANESLSEQDVLAFAQQGGFNKTDTLLIQNEIPLKTTLKAMEKAQEAGVLVIFNPAPVSGVTLECLKNADVVVVNESEAETLTGVNVHKEQGIEKAVQILLDAGVKAAVVTLGKDGAVFGNGSTLLKQPAFQVPVMDTTAAGDTFAGAFASAFTNETDAMAALRFAAAAAALSVTKKGAQPSVPTKEEVHRFLKEKTRP